MIVLPAFVNSVFQMTAPELRQIKITKPRFGYKYRCLASKEFAANGTEIVSKAEILFKVKKVDEAISQVELKKTIL